MDYDHSSRTTGPQHQDPGVGPHGPHEQMQKQEQGDD